MFLLCISIGHGRCAMAHRAPYLHEVLLTLSSFPIGHFRYQYLCTLCQFVTSTPNKTMINSINAALVVHLKMKLAIVKIEKLKIALPLEYQDQKDFRKALLILHLFHFPSSPYRIPISLTSIIRARRTKLACQQGRMQAQGIPTSSVSFYAVTLPPELLKRKDS